jgi:mono/diheme cytochrome c family protein
MKRLGIAVGAGLLACGIVAASFGSLIQHAPLSATKLKNPFANNEQAQLAGAKLYARECASCHGENREGRRSVPPLIQQEVHDAAPGTLFWVLRNGSLRRGMPSFAHLPEPHRWQIISFLQSRDNH